MIKGLPPISKSNDFWTETTLCFECSVCHEVNERENEGYYMNDTVECEHCGNTMRIVD